MGKDTEKYYKIWKKNQYLSEYMESDLLIPVIFPTEYIEIKGKDIKETECPATMKKLFELAERIHLIDDTYINIYLYSRLCGNGKTMWATILAHQYVKKTGKRAYFVKDEDLNRLSTQLNSFNNKDAIYTIDRLLKVPLLVIDDIGTLELNKNNSILYHTLIDKRMISKLPTIYTSNHNEDALSKQLNGKLASRIWGLSYHVEFLSGDVRKNVTKNPFETGGE